MLQGFKRLARGGFLLRELRGLRTDVAGLRAASERIATAMEVQNAHHWPARSAPVEGSLAITYVETEQQAELMDIETRLTTARGIPPTEEEVLEEYQRRQEGEAR